MNVFNEEILNYINSLNNYFNFNEFDIVYSNAIKNKIPVIRKNTAKFIYFIVKIKNPELILEIGTGSGFSTLWMYKAISPNSKIITLERDLNRYNEANKLFQNYSNIELIYSDAFNYLKDNNILFDIIFLDAQKRDYIKFLPLVKEKLKNNGILITDNFLFGGKVVNLKPEEKEKYSGGVELLKEFNESLAKDNELETLFLSIDDGITISIKKVKNVE